MMKIAIAEDNPFMRESIFKLCEILGLIILCSAKDGVELENYLSSNKLNPLLLPDIILMDICMPNINGIAATIFVNGYFGFIKVIALSLYSQEKPVIDMLEVGAMGFIDKNNITSDEVLLAIKEVMSNEFYISPNVIKEWQIPPEYLKTGYHKKYKTNLLNSVEYEFLSHCGRDLGYKEIADKMNMKVHTLTNYSTAVLEKLNIRSRAGLAAYALKHGLTQIYHPEGY